MGIVYMEWWCLVLMETKRQSLLYCYDKFGNRVVRYTLKHGLTNSMHHRMSVKTIRGLRVQGETVFENDDRGHWQNLTTTWNRPSEIGKFLN